MEDDKMKTTEVREDHERYFTETVRRALTTPKTEIDKLKTEDDKPARKRKPKK